MPRALSDLSLNFWADSDISQRTKLHWLREPLEGVGVLHAMGIMHRDIRPKNMLMMSITPARASLCDYGKATEAEKSITTTIGPISTLAPEVWTTPTDGPYTKAIDMWAYGYAIAEILGYSVEKYPGSDGFHSNDPEITHNRHSAILEMLHAHSDETVKDKPLVDLVSKLLVWDPKECWSAHQALEHECWDTITQKSEEENRDKDVASSLRKKAQLIDLRLKSRG